MSPLKRRERITKIFTRDIPLVIFLLVTLFPFYWILNTAFKTSEDAISIPIQYWPAHFNGRNFLDLTTMGFDRYFMNSLFVAVLTTVIVMVLSLMGGYAMSRYRFRGRSIVYLIMLITQMLPAVVLMIPLFEIMNNLSLINNLWSLVIICSCSTLAYCMLLMMGFYNAAPISLEEAAQIDGCTLVGAVIRVLLPTMAPSIIATGAYAFINAWNVYVYAIAFITDKKQYTLPLGLNAFMGEFSTDYTHLAAGCVLALIPVLVIFAFLQRHMAGGATAGAVKG